jgi:hypothetical protein
MCTANMVTVLGEGGELTGIVLRIECMCFTNMNIGKKKKRTGIGDIV